MRINTDGSNQEVLLDSTDNIPAVQGMAVDWIARLVNHFGLIYSRR